MAVGGGGRRRRIERMPEGFQPLLHPRLVTSPPTGPGWIHEIKYDGYRLQANIGDQIRLFTRKGHDWAARLPELAVDLRTLPPCILDCELCALDAEGRPDFSGLQAAISRRQTADLVLFAFDILWGKGEDQRGYPLADRKMVLEEVLGVSFSERLRDVPALPGAGAALLASAARLGIEGIVSKQLGGAYAVGRQDLWLKAKARPRIPVVIGGFLQAPLKPFGGLLVGVYEGDALRYAGSVRTGFGGKDKALIGQLRSLAAPNSPFRSGPKKTGEVHWVRPELVASVEIAEWTAAGKLRQASFKGLREDLPPHQVGREKPTSDLEEL